MRIVSLLGVVMMASAVTFGCNSQSTGPDSGTTETGMGTMNDPGGTTVGTDARVGPTGSPDNSSAPQQSQQNETSATGSGAGASGTSGGVTGSGTGAASPATTTSP